MKHHSYSGAGGPGHIYDKHSTADNRNVLFLAFYRLWRCSVHSLKSKVILLGLLLVLFFAVPVPAQIIKVNDDTTLKQIIIFGRHSIRSGTSDPSSLNRYSADPYPEFTGVPTGYLTPRGQQAASLLGSYFREYLLHEGLLTGSTQTDLDHSYFRANSIQRSNMTAAKFGEGLIPGATIPVHSYQITLSTPPYYQPDPIFDPIAAGVVTTADPDRALAEVQGIYGDGAAMASAYSGELSLVSNVLYPPGTHPLYPPGTPPSPAPQGAVDPTNQLLYPITFTAIKPIQNTGGSVATGGLNVLNSATDPFVMQYADGFAQDDVGWGRLTPDALSQQTRLTVLQIQIAMRTPYMNRLQSSNAASHVLRSMTHAASGINLPGAFGNAKTKVNVIVSSDYYVAGLAGLLGVHWLLPGYQPDYCAPGGALIFELRQNKRSKEHLVRVFYTAQTFDQLRTLKPLTLEVPPATMQLAVPGGSNSPTDLDVKFTTFKKLLMEAIDQKYVQPYSKEVPPGVLVLPSE